MEAQITLRPATRDDLEAILAVQRQAPEAAPWSADDYASLFFADGTICLLADYAVGERAVGILLARVVADEAEILNLAVAPFHRRRGIGRRLVAEALSRAQAQGARQCWLEVRASNRAALDFYRALGFVEERRRRDYYRDPVEDAVICVRRLAASGAAP